MTLDAWLHTRRPVPPPRLEASLAAALGARRGADSANAADECLAAAHELLGELLSRASAGRESALDLLTVDALVTYAFEAAAADPATIGRRASDAMARLSAAAAA